MECKERWVRAEDDGGEEGALGEPAFGGGGRGGGERQRVIGLVVEAAKRISTGRSYALSATLKIEEGKEEEVTAIVEWAHEKMVRPLLTAPIGLAAYEYKDGQIGHMMNPIGPKGGGLDDAIGQAGTKQQSMVINQGLGDTEERATFDLDSMLKKISLKDKSDKAAKQKDGASRLFRGKKYKATLHYSIS